MTIPIAIGNQAGGVGKTTTTIQLGGALAERGHDVLLIDADPQGTLTEGTGFDDIYDKKILSLHQVMTDPTKQNQVNEIIQQSHDEFDVIPANKAMDALKDQLVSTVANAEMRLKLVIDEIDHDYDFILIDCPPDLSKILDNALIAAQNIILPVNPTRRSIRAIKKMQEEIGYLENSFPSVDDISVLAVVVNEVEDRPNNDTKEMLEFYENAPHPVYHINRRVAIRRSYNNGLSVFEHEDPAKTDDVRDEYRAIAMSIGDSSGTEVRA
jgi:chromosome partitioning protein